MDVWAYYNNAEEVELFLNGESLGTRSKSEDDLNVQWRTPFEAGELKAISRKDGETVKETIIQTAGDAASINLTADRNEITADGYDLSFITIEILDADGIPVPTANNRIQFEVSGPGKIVGVDNGDPTSHESFKAEQRKSFNGKALLIVQSTEETGEITVTATSEGLPTQTISIKTH